VAFRKPRLKDGAQLWRLAGECSPLEPNSCYAYLLLCYHFSDTCVVAEQGGEIAGFLAAYRPPALPGFVFVWQVAVRQGARGRGIASAMLDELLRREACRDVCFLEATVAPSNQASQALFRSLARRLEARCEETPLFAREMFAEEGHEEEILFTIGPLLQPAMPAGPLSQELRSQEVSDG
jgi:L-2,4-diaminobutyric acid acetyltransferase